MYVAVSGASTTETIKQRIIPRHPMEKIKLNTKNIQLIQKGRKERKNIWDKRKANSKIEDLTQPHQQIY